LFTFGKVDVIWFDTRVSDRSSLHVLHISQVSDQTFGLKLKVETGLSIRYCDPLTQWCMLVYAE